jgi:rod shape-determining protein MreC
VRIGRSQRFDQARPFATLGLLLAVWLVVPVAVRSFLRASFFELNAPVPVAASYARDLQEFWSLRLHSKDELIEAGRDQARLNASYALSIQRNAELEDQIGRLQNLLKLPPAPHFRLEHARVVSRDFAGWWQRLIIRKGADYGLPVGAPVVFSGGVVGRIAEVHTATSVVELITDPAVRLAAVVAGDPRPVSYQGGLNPTFGPARGTIEFVPLDLWADAAQPKLLVTSGLGGVFPPGLVIGRIVKVESSTDGLFKTGDVQLDPRLAELTEVTVLVPDPAP